MVEIGNRMDITPLVLVGIIGISGCFATMPLKETLN